MNNKKLFRKLDVTIQASGKHTLTFDPHFPLKIVPFAFGPTDTDIAPNCHDYLELIYIYAGTATYAINNSIQVFNRDDVFLLGPAEFHSLKHNAYKPYQAIAVAFMPELFYAPGGNPLESRYLLPFQGRPPGVGNKVPVKKAGARRILELILRMRDEMTQKKAGYELAVRHKLSEIILMALEAYPASALHNQAHTKQQEKLNRLGPLLEHLNKNYEQQISLGQMAQMANLSPAHFCRFFREVTGKTPGDYVVCVRIDAAKQLLRSTDLSVLDVVYKSGFNNPGYFYRVFKKKTRLSPNQFRALRNQPT